MKEKEKIGLEEGVKYVERTRKAMDEEADVEL
jgi:hypothetical protein